MSFDEQIKELEAECKRLNEFRSALFETREKFSDVYHNVEDEFDYLIDQIGTSLMYLAEDIENVECGVNGGYMSDPAPKEQKVLVT